MMGVPKIPSTKEIQRGIGLLEALSRPNVTPMFFALVFMAGFGAQSYFGIRSLNEIRDAVRDAIAEIHAGDQTTIRAVMDGNAKIIEAIHAQQREIVQALKSH